jgi:hypothetical protein
MFDRIDANDDRRINYQEFLAALSEIKKWGVNVRDPRAAFDEIDVDAAGLILFDEFANWAISNSLDLEEDDDTEGHSVLSAQSGRKSTSSPRRTERSDVRGEPPSAGSSSRRNSVSHDRTGQPRTRQTKTQVVSKKTPGFSPAKGARPLAPGAAGSSPSSKRRSSRKAALDPDEDQLSF